MHFHASTHPDSLSGSTSPTFTHLSSRCLATADTWSEMLGLLHPIKTTSSGITPHISTSHPAGYFRSTGRQCVSGSWMAFHEPPVANRLSELLAPTTDLLWRGYAVGGCQMPTVSDGHLAATDRRELPPGSCTTTQIHNGLSLQSGIRISVPPSYCARG